MSIPSSDPSRPGYQRQVANQLNPGLQGFVWPRYDTAPGGADKSLSYFDMTKGKPGWYNGSAWKYAAEQDASGNMVISGTFAAGNTTITGTLNVSGATALASTLSAKNTTITGTISVSGTSTMAAVNSGNHAVTGTLSVSSTASLGPVTATTLTASTSVSVTSAFAANSTRVDALVPVRLPSYTVAGVPSAATHAQSIIYVSDGTANKRLAVSDGSNWRWPDGVIVS